MANGYKQAKPKTPTEQVVEMQKQGKDDAEIITTLTNQGLKPEQINSALNQAKIKQAVTAPAAPAPTTPATTAPTEAPEGLAPSIMSQQQAPQPTPAEEVPMPGMVAEGQMPTEQYGYEGAGIDTEAIEEIAEEIISEKWDEAKLKISTITEWKDYTDNRMHNAESKLKRIESSLDSLQAALLGKVQKYGQSIKDLGTEMKSIQGAFSRVLSPLASNVHELQRLTGKLKTGKVKKAKKRKSHSKKRKKRK